LLYVGTGRFCSKSCRYEAHALNVAQQRRTNGSGIVTTAATPGNEKLQNALYESVSSATPLAFTQGISLPLSLSLSLSFSLCLSLAVCTPGTPGNERP
jgi:hypothetical protein